MRGNGLFDPNNFFFHGLSRMVDVVGLSLLWTFLCLPVITIGPATAALYHTAVKGLRAGEERIFLRYLESFRENLKQGILATVLCGLLAGVLYLGFHIMYMHRDTPLGVFLYAVYYIVLLLPAGALCYIFPLLGRFSFSMKGLFWTAVQLAAAHLPSTLVVLLITAQSLVFMLNRIWPFLFLPVVLELLTSLFLERIFAKYLPEEDGE